MRVRPFVRYSRMAAGSLLTCAPLLFARRPQTTLRVLCIGAFEYLARLGGRRLDRKARRALACACDFGALRNDFYDQGNLDRHSYRDLRRRLSALVPQTATHRYIRALRSAERGRPIFGPKGFSEPAAVVAYRVRVLELSLSWLQVISRRLIKPRVFQSLVALVGLVQLVDDVIDWKDDCASRRPTYVTALLREWRQPSRQSLADLHRYANHFRGLLVAAAQSDAEATPLAIAGLLVWFLATALMKVRFAR